MKATIPMDLAGETINQYEIIELVGAGGMATVYRAYQPALDRDVAVKVLHTRRIYDDDFTERFVREARAVAQLSHPNILPIYDIGVEDDLNYFVMKYVPGRTLKDLMGQPIDLPTACRFIDQVAGALDHAHERGIIHRDIKPGNILVENNWLLLADFGLAKIKVTPHDLTGTGAIMGTPTYLAPEQGEGRPIDHRADIYSLGVVLYEMLTGKVPYEADTPIGVIFKHVHEPLPQPRLLNPNLSIGVEQVILKALAKEPANRYQQAGELAQALRAHLPYNTSTTVTNPADHIQPARLLICYKRNTNPDQQLANYLHKFLAQQGHQVFIDRSLRTGDAWLEEIDQQIKNSDYIIILLSEESANSEMVQAEIRRAHEHRKRQSRPHALPVRVAYEDMLPYSIDAFLDPLQYVVWNTEIDNESVGRKILTAIGGRLSTPTLPIIAPSNQHIAFSEDGRPVTNDDSLHPPLPEFDPRFLEALEAPGGVVKLRDKFYIERRADLQLKREIIKAGTTTTIRASRQSGKSSLVVRGVHYARQHDAKIVNLDLQRVDTDRLTSPDLFLRDLAQIIVRKLRLDMSEVDNFWQGSLGPQDKLTYLMEDYILPETDTSIILALDEVDRLLNVPFHSDFFALLRSWHNSRALDEEWDKLNMVMVISTEPYQLIADVNQSPFNVGLKIYLEDFDQTQVADLNQRYGSPVSDSDFLQLVDLLGGHPYLTRKALYTLVTEQLIWADLLKTATFDHGPFGDHLRRHQWLLRDEPILQDALKNVIEHEQCADEMALFRLLQAGLVKGSGEVYTCRCDLYRLYFKDKL